MLLNPPSPRPRQGLTAVPAPYEGSLLNYMMAYPGRLRDQFNQGMQQFARTRNPVAALGALNPTTPFIQDAALQAGGLIAPQANQLNQAVSQASENLGLGPLSIPEVTDEQLAPFLMLGMGSPSKMGFFSPSGKALTTAPGKGTSQQYLAHLKKEPGATKEAKQTGLIQRLEEAPGTLTKEEVVSMWNPIELTETARAGHRDHVIGGLSVGGVDFYRDGMPVDYDPYLLAKRAGLDKPTPAEHARAVLIEDVLIDEWKLREGWEERGEQGVVDVVRQKISERIASNEEQLEYDPDDDALREQILELRDIQNRIPHLYTVQMDEASRHPLKYAESEGLNLPGGEEPKEILVQFPISDPTAVSGQIRFQKRAAERADDVLTSLAVNGYENLDYGRTQTAVGKDAIDFNNFSEDEYRALRQIVAENEGSFEFIDRQGGTGYQSSHWDEPNVLAHIRTNKRDVGGVRALHAEEFQSDWHQEGQKKGYQGRTPTLLEAKENFAISDDDWANMTPATQQSYVNEIIEQGDSKGVPDAPYKKDWHELAFKRFLMEGINDPSVDRITWTSGDVQADRYNLAKQVESVYWKPDTEEFNAILKGGADSIDRVVSREQLSEVIGKEAAERLLDAPRNDFGSHVLEGADLEIGGEFHKNLYDKKIPQFAKKFLKKYGVEPQKFDGSESAEVQRLREELKVVAKNFPNMSPEELIRASEIREAIQNKSDNNKYWYIDITPEMRQDLQQKGVPLAMNDRKPQAGLLA